MNGKAIVLGSWLFLAATATWGWLSQMTPQALGQAGPPAPGTSGANSTGGYPPPALYLPASVVMSMLYVLAGPAPQLASVMALSLDIGALLAHNGAIAGQVGNWLSMLTQGIAGAQPPAPAGVSSP